MACDGREYVALIANVFDLLQSNDCIQSSVVYEITHWDIPTIDFPQDLEREDLVSILIFGLGKPRKPYSSERAYATCQPSAVLLNALRIPVPSVLISSKSSHRNTFDECPTLFWFGLM